MNSPRIIVLVQSRMSSSRLPGKALIDLCGKPVIRVILERAKLVTKKSGVVLATSCEREDDELALEARKAGVIVFRGSLVNVMTRTYEAALSVEAEHVVRIPGDKIGVDPEEVDRLVQLHIDSGADYSSNFLPTDRSQDSTAEGLEVEVFRLQALARARQMKIATEHDKEHVTSIFYLNASFFKCLYFPVPHHLSKFRNSRLNLDTVTDLAVARRVFQEVGFNQPAFEYFSRV